MNQENDYLEKYSAGFGRLAVWIYDHRWLVLILSLMFLGVGLYLAGKVRTDNSFESYFDKTDPTYDDYLTYQEDFGSDEVSYILYKAEDQPHGPFNLDVMRKIAHLTEALEDEVPFVREVTSLANVEFIEAEGDLIEIHELLLDFPETQEELLEIRDMVMKKPIYIGGLINRDATHAAIVLEMTRTSTQILEELRYDPEGGDGLENLYPQVSNNKIQEILSRPEYRGITFYPSGDVTANSIYNEVLVSETNVLTLATFILVGIILMFCFRMWFMGIVGPLLVVLLGLVLTMGFMGLMGYPIDALFLITPTLLTAIGVAQSVHLLTEFRICRSKGLERREALQQTLTLVGVPCLLAALTTAAGFFAMVVSDLDAVSEFAVFGSVGVLFAFGLSITLLLCFLTFGRKNSDPVKDRFQSKNGLLSRLLNGVIAFNLRHSLGILVVSSILFLLSIMGIWQLKVAYDFIEEFKKNTVLRQTLTYTEKVMEGLLNIVYVFDTGRPDGIKNSEVLKQLELLQTQADQNPLVKKTYSIVDIIKDMNQSFHGDDPAYYRLPEEKNLISQYLLMYEISGGKELEDYVTGDYSRTALELRLGLADSIKISHFLKDMQLCMDKNPVTAAQVKLTGIGLLWVKIADYIGSSQINGYLLAFAMIACFMCVIFRSFKVGLLSMIPNLTPVMLTLGAMGWLGLHLDYFRLLLATVAIGIAVDDTVHLMTRIRREFLRCGDYAQSIKNSLSTVGHALIITSVVLVCAFLAFLYSQMAVLSSFGVLLAITISTALIADLFLLPGLILVFKPFGKEFEPAKTNEFV